VINQQNETVVASGYAVVDPLEKRKTEDCQYSEVDKDRKKELREV
jgi:hypothetical protein